MSGYWLVIAPVAVAALAGVVVLARRLSYHPAHAAAGGQPAAAAAPDTGSMVLAEELSWGWRRPPERPADADPWGIPAEEWTERTLAELHDGITALDQLEPAPMPQYEAEQLEQPEPELLEPAEPAPWYDGAWIDGQLGELFAWVRRVREQV